MNLQLVLGNQLFDPKVHFPVSSKETIFFMREDLELCTHYKYHKHKIIFFLSAMRKYSEELRALHHEVHYQKLTRDSQESFEDSLKLFIESHEISSISYFEIEDKFFERRITNLVKSLKLKTKILASPMFLTTRDQFGDYLAKVKKPYMKTFYEGQRRRLNILVDINGRPVGDKWSFDEENRKPLPKDFRSSPLPNFELSPTDSEVISLVDKVFHEHPGFGKDYWLPSDRTSALHWLRDFITKRLADFGPYEDALSDKFDFISHSVLTPFLNSGLLTPGQIVSEVLEAAKKRELPMNSIEGFIRQIIGWREFIRGIYQNFSDQQDKANFWNHQRKLGPEWYTGTTGVPPLDQVIRKTIRLGYAHHIERLMVLGSFMLLLEVHPKEAHRWFMEMFIDSSDWVMGPNVYGMALFSDGGLFATKPYFCGSNYYRKMGGYKAGPWQEGVDGLYWRFIEKNKQFFLKNPRMSMMVKTLEKMPSERKATIFQAAQELRNRITSIQI